MIYFLLIGSGFLSISAIFNMISKIVRRVVKGRRTRCTVQVPAAIAGISSQNIYTDESPSTRIRTPVYNYVYNGKDYTIHGNFTSKASVGTSIIIFINPDKPSELFDPQDDSQKASGIFYLVSTLCGLTGVLVFIGGLLWAA